MGRLAVSPPAAVSSGVPVDTGLVIDTTLTPREREEWDARLTDPETWLGLKRTAESMLEQLASVESPSPKEASAGYANLAGPEPEPQDGHNLSAGQPREGDEPARLAELREGMAALGFTVGRNPDGVDDSVAATLLVVKELIEREHEVTPDADVERACEAVWNVEHASDTVPVGREWKKARELPPASTYALEVERLRKTVRAVLAAARGISTDQPDGEQ